MADTSNWVVASERGGAALIGRTGGDCPWLQCDSRFGRRSEL